MKFVPVKTPWIVKRIFPNYVWDIKTTENILYLTFDDGPTPEITTWTLDVLKQYNAEATFFCIGENIKKHPDIFQKILNEGHAVGNHTHNHLKGWQTSTEAYLANVLDAQEVINSRFHKNADFDLEIDNQQSAISNQQSTINNLQSPISNLFRPPYGQLKNKQGQALRKLGYKIIMWDVIAFDWIDSISTETCFQNVKSKAVSGSIIVFHDSVKASKQMQYALPKVLEYFSKKGFEFRRIPE